MESYSVFYLTGGSTNFVCCSMFGRFSYEVAEKHVSDIRKQGFIAKSVKAGHIIGGFCSYTDFQTKELAESYYKFVQMTFN